LLRRCRPGSNARGHLAIDLHRIHEEAVVALGQRYQLSACDAAYLWLAADLNCALATFDGKLAEAAKAHLANLD
jgi:predicted nucleic acid-binding protein